MILQALNDYYSRLLAEGIVDVATEGFQKQAIPFVVVLRPDGRFVSLLDTRVGEGKAKKARDFKVPKAVKKTSGVAANLLWDAPAYVFGRPKPDPKKDQTKLAERALEQKGRFRTTIREKLARVLDDAGVDAVLKFLERDDFDAVYKHPSWQEVEQSGGNISFQLESDECLVCERPAVVVTIRALGEAPGSNRQTCLVTGEDDEPARLHASIKGVYGAQTSGANIVSFNLPAFTSFDKPQSFNAPVGKRAEFAYTTALNHLLERGSLQRLQVGDASTVFWAEKKHHIESVFAELFGEPPKGEPEQDYKQLVATFRAPQTGAPPQLDPKTRFFVLGLAPNAARIAVRFWYAGTVDEIAQNIQTYFDDIEIVRPSYEPNSFLPLNGLLAATGPKVKYDSKKQSQVYFRGGYYEVAPGLAGEIMRAILARLPFPRPLLAATIRRCRAEHLISYPRAALIKAVLVRDNRFGTRSCSKHEKEVSMSLDLENTNDGYRLGRLFAVLEKIQEEANPGINATIRDRFYGSASATPVAAFPHLMKLKNHHLSKLENRGRAINLEKMIGEIIDGIRDFPTHLSLADQGRFAVGYYHQRQAFFVK